MSTKRVKCYFHALVFLSFCYCKVKCALYLVFHFYMFQFLVCHCLYLQTMSATPLIVTYKNFRKLVQCKEHANMYDDVTLKFPNCPIFPRRIKLQYEDEEVNDFIDLDSSIQLHQHKSNQQRKLVILTPCKQVF